MFFHLQYIHLFRPFLKYTPQTSPLPAHVSPRRICTANAGAISKLMRLYKKLYNLRQICNIAVYMVHSACTIHMLNLPEKTAKRDITHGVKHLEEIAEDWLCARRSLSILSVLARKWNIELPEEAATVLQRTDEKYGIVSTSDVPSPSNKPPISNTQSPHSLAHTPPGNPQDGYSPGSTFSAPTPQQVMSLDLPPSSLSAPMLDSSLAVSGLTSHLQQPQQQRLPQSIPSSTMSMPDNLASLTTWTISPLPQPIPSYSSQPFGSLPNTLASPTATPTTAQSSRTSTTRVNGGSVYAIDGQDWYLKDGVSWQQNFSSWGLSPATTPGPSTGLGAGSRHQQRHSNAGSAAAGSGGNSSATTPGPGMGGGDTSSSIFMFRGVDPMVFDSLGAMGSLDSLPGLD